MAIKPSGEEVQLAEVVDFRRPRRSLETHPGR